MVAHPASQVEKQSISLRFRYEGEAVELISAVSVMKFSLPSDSVEAQEAAGFWVTLTGDREQAIYRRVMYTPIRFYVEAFSNDPEVGIVRFRREAPQGTFTIRVPDVPAATAVILFNSPPDAPDRPARPIARFEFAAVREQMEAKE